MPNNFLETLETHQQEITQLHQSKGLPAKLNPVLSLIGLNYLKFSIPIISIISLLCYLSFKEEILEIARTLLFI